MMKGQTSSSFDFYQFVPSLSLLATDSFLPNNASRHTVRAMTFNIRLDHAGDKENNWKFRKSHMIDFVEEQNPDFLGIQEAMPHQLDYLVEHLPSMNFIGQARDGFREGEYSAILYNSDSWQVVVDSTFWLSASPEKVSMGWDAACRRVCTYGLFVNDSQDTMAVFNTHLDHVGLESRAQSIKLILQQIDLYKSDYATVLMGDFNFTPDDENYSALTEHLEDTQVLSSKIKIVHEGTFNGFEPVGPYTRRIDYMFNSKFGLQATSYTTFDVRINERFLSDHFPVMVDFLLNHKDQNK